MLCTHRKACKIVYIISCTCIRIYKEIPNMKLDSTISALLLWTAGECMATGWCGRMEADNHHGSSPSKRRPEIIKEHCDHRKRRWFLSMWLC